jgi:Bacterial regulatory proteins, luxR family
VGAATDSSKTNGNGHKNGNANGHKNGSGHLAVEFNLTEYADSGPIAAPASVEPAPLSRAEIAAALTMSEGTVKFHINHLLHKLCAADRTQALLTALKRGFAYPD